MCEAAKYQKHTTVSSFKPAYRVYRKRSETTSGCGPSETASAARIQLKQRGAEK